MNEQLIPHLFRTEFRKIVSVLCKHFGIDQVELAEDIASDTFLTATQSWGLNGTPDNPVAWLYVVAKNKASNYLKRELHFHTVIKPVIKDNIQTEEIDLSPQNIIDSQLQMMFAICHPSISAEAQVGLSLRILCGFGIQEIADAFLSNKETINKRLQRAKEKLREEKIVIELPSSDIMVDRLNPVLKTIYLLFNEGYYSTSQHTALRKDLCLEAMRLCTMLIENNETNKPGANALLALMCFHASRFDARTDDSGSPILYEDQDDDRWNTNFISKGGYFLKCASTENYVTTYHFEAAIAYWHTQKEDTKDKWENILQLYNQLLELSWSPIAALNRTYALAKAKGKLQAIVEAEKLQLKDLHFYFMLLGELYSEVDNKIAKQHFEKALTLSKNGADKKVIHRKIEKLG